MNRIIISILFLLGLLSQLSAQHINKMDSFKLRNEFNLSVGWSKSLLKDLNFSPLNYQQNGIIYSLDYSRIGRKCKSIFDVQLNFLSNDLKTSNIDHFTTNLIIGNFKVSYLKRINKIPFPFKYYLGTEYQTNLNYLNYSDQEAFSYLIGHSLNLKTGLSFILSERSSFLGTLSIPLITLMIRPPYNGFNEELQKDLNQPFVFLTKGDFVTLDKYQAINISISYNYQFSKKIGFSLNWQMIYQNLYDNNRFIQFQNVLKTGFIYQF
jgi:hypothetical protein